MRGRRRSSRLACFECSADHAQQDPGLEALRPEIKMGHSERPTCSGQRSVQPVRTILLVIGSGRLSPVPPLLSATASHIFYEFVKARVVCCRPRGGAMYSRYEKPGIF